MYIPDWKTEEKLAHDGYQFIIGIDEVGRGPLAGPVVACAVALKEFEIFELKGKGESEMQEENEKMWALVRDSKSLSEKQREKVYNFILENFHIGIGLCDAKTIDEINILQASFLAMKKAHTDLMANIRSYVRPSVRMIFLVDGDKELPSFSHKQVAVPQGDKKIKTIAAASIIAKVTRDRIMLKYAEEYPAYGFEKHKGYGTKIHMEALHKFGASPLHRRSFRPVADALVNRSINRELSTQ